MPIFILFLHAVWFKKQNTMESFWNEAKWRLLEEHQVIADMIMEQNNRLRDELKHKEDEIIYGINQHKQENDHKNLMISYKNQDIAARDQTIARANASLDRHVAEIERKDREIAALKAEVAAALKRPRIHSPEEDGAEERASKKARQ